MNCGPVAIFNALRWADAPISLKYIRKLEKDCKCENRGDKKGTYPEDLQRVLLKQKKLKVESIWANLKVRDIDLFLNKGFVIIVSFVWLRTSHNLTEGGAHYALIVEKNKKGYKVANFESKKAIRYLKKEELKECLRIFVFNGLQVAGNFWIISKKGKV